eukprot:9152713-Alexandrium_andersonii.AAC.1
MLDGVQSTHAHSPACGPPGAQAPSEVRVNVRAESGPLVPPRTKVDAPRAHDQVANQPGKSSPVR